MPSPTFSQPLVLHHNVCHVSGHLKGRRGIWVKRMEQTCLLWDQMCVTQKYVCNCLPTLWFLPCYCHGSCICSFFRCKCMADPNLMFNGCSKVQVITQRNELKYHRQIDFARFSVCLHTHVNRLSHRAVVLLRQKTTQKCNVFWSRCASLVTT